MPVNFFLEICKSRSNSIGFGICDDPPPAKNPAYLDENNNEKWIATVQNKKEKEINFYAIDNCVTILRDNNQQESRCDGMIHFNNSLIFVELKDRGHRSWLAKGRKQLEVTINVFKRNNNIAEYSKIEAYLCNKQRPTIHPNHMIEIEKFKDNTKLELKVQNIISIA